MKDDPLVAETHRQKIAQLADNLEKLKAMYTADTPAKGGNDSFSSLKATHRRLLIDLCRTLKLDVPGNILFMLDESPARGNANERPKNRPTNPGNSTDNAAKPE